MDKVQAVKFIRWATGIDSIVECKELYESNPVLAAVAEKAVEIEKRVRQLDHELLRAKLEQVK